MVYPAFGIVFGKAISAFSTQDRHELRHAGDRNALWYGSTVAPAARQTVTDILGSLFSS